MIPSIPRSASVLLSIGSAILSNKMYRKSCVYTRAANAYLDRLHMPRDAPERLRAARFRGTSICCNAFALTTSTASIGISIAGFINAIDAGLQNATPLAQVIKRECFDFYPNPAAMSAAFFALMNTAHAARQKYLQYKFSRIEPSEIV